MALSCRSEAVPSVPLSTPPARRSLRSGHHQLDDRMALGSVSVTAASPSLNGAITFDEDGDPSERRDLTSVDVNFSPGAALGRPVTPPQPHPLCSPSLPVTGLFVSPPKLTPRTKRSYAMLEADSHALQHEILEQEREDKTTKRIYERGLKSYCEWFEHNQVRVVAADPELVPLPALPITAAKVAMFLQHEMTREKKKVSVIWP